MQTRLIQCPRCKASLLEGGFNRDALEPCPSCGTPLQIEVFPAFFRRAEPGRTGDAVTVEGESSCFYHPEKKAVQACGSCGRFVCALCDCQVNDQHLCPACLEAGATRGKIKTLENRRVLYDSIALSLAVLPVVIVFLAYFTCVTAPLSLYVAIRYWNAPRSIIHRTKLRYVLAILFATLQIVGWGAGIVYLTTRNG
jgi:hypothetical protein